jgi:hypothetical protein
MLDARRKASVMLSVVVLLTVGSTRTDKRDGVGHIAFALGMLRAIHSAEATFATRCGGGGYAASQRDLAAPPKGSSTGVIVEANATSGYVVTVEPGPGAYPFQSESCNGVTGVSSYFVHAEPVPTGSPTHHKPHRSTASLSARKSNVQWFIASTALPPTASVAWRATTR